MQRKQTLKSLETCLSVEALHFTRQLRFRLVSLGFGSFALAFFCCMAPPFHRTRRDARAIARTSRAVQTLASHGGSLETLNPKPYTPKP